MDSRRSFAPILLAVAAACASVAPRAVVATHHPQLITSAAVAPAITPIAFVERDDALCERRTTAALPSRSDVREGSAIVIAYTPVQAVAYVADADSHSIHTVALDAKELGRTDLDASPGRLLMLADGRVAVTLPDKSRLAVLEPSVDPAKPMTVLCSRKLPAEPWGIARSKDDAKLVVSSTWGAALTVLDAKTFALATARTVPLARDPRSVTVDDEGVAFVSHSVGATLSAVDLGHESAPVTIGLGMRKATPLMLDADKNVVRTGSQGFALARMEHRVLVPMTSVDPGKFDPEVESKTYYGPPFDGVPKQTPTVAVVDTAQKAMLGGDLLGTSSELYRRECLLPRAAVVRSKTRSLFVACRGIDSVLELDADAVDPFRAERHRFAVPMAPEGLAIDERGDRLVAFSQLGAALTVIPFDGKETIIALDYHPPAALAAVARGRQLFFRTDDSHISDDGLGCASCHIDARDDGITWRTPVGPRQTPMLVGRLEATSPYGWEGNRPTLVDYISHTVTNLGGNGMPIEDVDAVIAFLMAASPPVTLGEASDVAHGAKLFGTSGCESCHTTGASDQQTHALSKLVRGDVMGGADSTGVDTPTLRFIVGTAPYFHDGRYRTLEDLLADPKSKMGASSKLSIADRGALAAYLRTL